MNQFEIVIPTLFGIEAITAREIRRLGLETKTVEDGRITLLGDFETVAKLNLWIRTGDRVLIKVGEFTAVTFDQLFEGCKSLPWSDWLPENCAFPVKGFSLKSALFSVSDCQSIIKKSVVESLKKTRHTDWLQETGPKYQIQFSIMRDKVSLMLDTSGEGLHKRGYRALSNAAPIRETMASAMILLSYWRKDRPFADPFCGSGTIPIEAAMIGKNIAPGLKRSFAAEKFVQMEPALWSRVRQEARELIDEDIDLEIYASDIDPQAIALTAGNSEIAGVDDVVRLSQKDVAAFTSSLSYGTVITNPPYGERLLDKKQAQGLYQTLGNVYRSLDKWSLYALTPDEAFESFFGKKADKKRKLYNGMIKCDLYQYFGPRPPRPDRHNS